MSRPSHNRQVLLGILLTGEIVGLVVLLVHGGSETRLVEGVYALLAVGTIAEFVTLLRREATDGAEDESQPPRHIPDLRTRVLLTLAALAAGTVLGFVVSVVHRLPLPAIAAIMVVGAVVAGVLMVWYGSSHWREPD